MLKHEKRQSFNAYLEETSASKNTRKFYDMMKRLSPKFKWNVKWVAIEKTRLPGSWPPLKVILLTLTLNKKSRRNDRL
jgi:hypothetical protein